MGLDPGSSKVVTQVGLSYDSQHNLRTMLSIGSTFCLNSIFKLAIGIYVKLNVHTLFHSSNIMRLKIISRQHNEKDRIKV
jgi:hypothetical protein